jgi:hypothetical protein
MIIKRIATLFTAGIAVLTVTAATAAAASSTQSGIERWTA